MSVILFMLLKKKPVVYKILTSVWVDLISAYPFVMALQTFTHYLHRDKSAIINLYYPFNYLIMKQSLLNNTVYSCRQKTSYYIDGITIQINTCVSLLSFRVNRQFYSQNDSFSKIIFQHQKSCEIDR